MKLTGKFMIACLIVSVVLAIISYFVLPETVAVQLSIGGTANTLPKIAAVLIPLALEALAFALSKTEGKQKGALIVAVVGVLMYVFMFIVNR